MHGDAHAPGLLPARADEGLRRRRMQRKAREPGGVVALARRQVAADDALAARRQVLDALVVAAVERRVDHGLGERRVAAAQQHAERQAERGGRVLRERLELLLQVALRAAQVDRLDADQGEQEQGRDRRREQPADGHAPRGVTCAAPSRGAPSARASCAAAAASRRGRAARPTPPRR